jgi:hypothetical protein
MRELPDEPADDWQPGPEVTSDLYAAWRNSRRGVKHGAKDNNPVWDWLIRTRISAYHANQHFRGPDSLSAGPAWSFYRFGQSRTALPDGRTLLVAGEHEDFYDPDFFIYNDVVVWHPDDRIDIHGYSESDFPPTDFHSATLVGDRLILVGRLGYAEDRQPGITPVLSLDVHSMRIDSVATSGENPGWIFQHLAVLEGDDLLICGGAIQDEHGILENIDDWSFNVRSRQWTRRTDRQWPRIEFVRKDGEMNHLWQIRHELDMQRFQSQAELTAEIHKKLQETAELVRSMGMPLDADSDLLEQLYSPEVEHEVVPRDWDNFDEHNVYRIRIEGVVVRYVEDSHSVVLTVEGKLPKPILDRLVADLCGKLSRLEGAEYLVKHR